MNDDDDEEDDEDYGGNDRTATSKLEAKEGHNQKGFTETLPPPFSCLLLHSGQDQDQE